MVILVSLKWHVLPTGGWGEPCHVVMPALALAALPTALIARVTRASVLEVLGQDYIRTARAKGLSSNVVHYRHVLKNALNPHPDRAGSGVGRANGRLFYHRESVCSARHRGAIR